MNQSQTIGALAAALSKAQTSFTPAVKDAANPFYKSRYLTLAGALDAVRAALGANGLALVQAVDATGDKLTLNTTLLHSSGEWIGSSYPINPVKNDPQGIGSAVSYGRRYSLMALLGIAAEDDDGEAAHGRAAKVATVTGEVKQKKTVWTKEQEAAGGALRNKIKENAAWDAEFCEIFRNMAYDSVEDTLEALRQFVEGCK